MKRSGRRAAAQAPHEDLEEEAAGYRPDPEPIPPGRGILGAVSQYYGPRTGGELPWERGDAYLVGQLGRAAVVVGLLLAGLYLVSPWAPTGGGGPLHAGRTLEGTASFAVVVTAAAVLVGVITVQLGRTRTYLSHTMFLQTDVPWKEMVVAVGKGLRALGVNRKRVRTRGGGLLVGYAFSVRADYAPLRVLGSPLGYTTWGGARSLFVVPLPIFRHPKWGQDIDHLVREVLGWARVEHVTTPSAPSLARGD